jgi:hypothetical protein
MKDEDDCCSMRVGSRSSKETVRVGNKEMLLFKEKQKIGKAWRSESEVQRSEEEGKRLSKIGIKPLVQPGKRTETGALW